MFPNCKNCSYSMSGSYNPCSDWCDECVYEYQCDHPEKLKEKEYEFKVPQEKQKIEYMTTEHTVDCLFKLVNYKYKSKI